VPNTAVSAWKARAPSIAARWQALPTPVRDGLLAATLGVAAFAPTLAAVAPEIGDLPVHPPDAWTVVLALAQCVPLAVRRRWPVACLAVVGVGFAAHELLAHPPTFAGVGLYLALYSAGAYQARLRAATPMVATAAYAGLAFALHGLGSPQHVPDFVAFHLALALVWAAGAGVRRWRVQEEQRRRLAAEQATASERARIARELHDVVTHHVTAMVVQADAAQYLVAGHPDRAADGLTAISGTGRDALTELRSLLNVLEATGDHAGLPSDREPPLGRLRDLVDHARRAGQPVEFSEVGTPQPVPADVERAAYRTVQEALTNAMKYARGMRTVVRVAHSEQEMEIDVTTAGPAGMASSDIGTGGRGLAGLRERLRLLDGSVDAGTCDDGGFRVHALIPRRRPA
jgi:signal transduction histidine kinase